MLRTHCYVSPSPSPSLSRWRAGYLQHTATHCNTLQHTATHCNTLQHTAANILQHTATEWVFRFHQRWQGQRKHLSRRNAHCNALQHTATHRNAPQRTATHRNTPQHTTTQHTTPHTSTPTNSAIPAPLAPPHELARSVLQCAAVCCSVLQCVAVQTPLPTNQCVCPSPRTYVCTIAPQVGATQILQKSAV